MKVITDGHKYELENFEDKSKPGQTIQFIEKKVIDTSASTGELKTINDGTTNEEVIEVLIDRINSLNTKFPCRENSIALTHIETAKLWLEKRTNDRKKRGVEGKALK